MQVLSLIDTPNQEFNCVLEDQNCTIQLRFLDENCYFSLWLDDTLICQNVIVLPKQKILVYNTNLFNGNFLLIDNYSNDDNQAKANYKQLSSRFSLVYISDEELAEL